MSTESTPAAGIYAFIADGEGICAAHVSGLGWMQLVSIKDTLVPSMSQIAEDIARRSGKTIRLMYFSDPVELKVFTR